jgi:hypothetical protein
MSNLVVLLELYLHANISRKNSHYFSFWFQYFLCKLKEIAREKEEKVKFLLKFKYKIYVILFLIFILDFYVRVFSAFLDINFPKMIEFHFQGFLLFCI